MADNAAQPIARTRSWPLTSAARDDLLEEIVRLRRDLASLTGQGLEEGIVRLPVALAARRLGMLKEVLEQCQLADAEPCAAIGRRATVCDSDGRSMSCQLVLPGAGDPGSGRISADSALGAAILGAYAGDVVEVETPAGRHSVTVTSVE